MCCSHEQVNTKLSKWRRRGNWSFHIIIITSQCRTLAISEHKHSIIMSAEEWKLINTHLTFRNKRTLIGSSNSKQYFYSQWKGSVWGVSFACDSPSPMWNIPWQWTLGSLPLEISTESMGSKLWPCTLGPKGCSRETELGWTMRLNASPDVCDWGDDRRERAQSDSWTWVVNLSP